VKREPSARARAWAAGERSAAAQSVRLACLATLLIAVLCVLGLGLMRAANVRAADAESKRDRVYLTQLALLVDGARRLSTYGESNLDDRDLLKFAGPLAERFVEMAGHMLPSPKLAVAHPHLLLVVENLERALDLAAAGDMGGYQKRSRIARDELANLDAVLKQLKQQRPPEPAR
jgi:hypothetical protein